MNILNVSIYGRYKVKHTYTYTYSDFDYNDFCKKTQTEEFEMDGHELLQKIVVTAIQDRDFSEITFGESFIAVSFFDSSSGHTNEGVYELQEVSNNE